MKHEHEHDHQVNASREENVKLLSRACGITLVFMLVEAVAGYVTGSLALWADAGHMLADVASLLLALVAAWFATKPATPGKTYGYYRSEILSGFVTGLMLIGIAGGLLLEAYERVTSPTEVKAVPMLIVAVIGLGVNLLSARILHNSAKEAVNVKAAYLEVMADLVASVGVIIGGIIIVFTRWYIVDSIISVLIALWIIPRTWRLLSECTNILMEGTPGDIDMKKLRKAISTVDGVSSIHDIHVWAISSGLYSMSGHLTLADGASPEKVLHRVTAVVQQDFGIKHSTIQVEEAGCAANDNHACLDGGDL